MIVSSFGVAKSRVTNVRASYHATRVNNSTFLRLVIALVIVSGCFSGVTIKNKNVQC